MPRVFHRNRPPWYNESVSRNVGKVSGVTTRPSFIDDYMGVIWKNKRAAETHPIAHRRLVQVRPPSEKLSPQLQLDSKSTGRAKMFADRGMNIATLVGNDTSRGRERALVKEWNNSNAARKMHEFMSPERVFRSAYHSVKPNQTLPYRPATPRSGRVPSVPRPSSGVAPRIAGSLASKMLGATGALGLLPGIIYLARGGTIGGMAGPLPPNIQKPSRINGQW